MNPYMSLLLILVIIGVLVGVFFMAQNERDPRPLRKAKARIVELEDEVERLTRRLDITTGYLQNLSGYELPSVSDSAIQLLARLDRLQKEGS